MHMYIIQGNINMYYKSNVLSSKPSDRFDRLILIMLHDWSINFMLEDIPLEVICGS